MTQTQFSDIIELLEDSTESHLADAFHMVPDQYQEGIADMIKSLRAERTQRAVIRQYVVHDVAAILENRQITDLKCFSYIKAWYDKEAHKSIA